MKSNVRFGSSYLRYFTAAAVVGGTLSNVQVAMADEEFFLDSEVQSTVADVPSTHYINIRHYPSEPAMVWAYTANSVCFINGMSGDFNGAGERIWIYQDRGAWAVGAKHGSGNGVIGRASCVRVPDASYYSVPLSWSQTTPGSGIETTLALGAPKAGYTWGCFLTAIQGKFQGAGESVRVYVSGNTAHLVGTSAQKGVAAEARCVQSTSFTAAVNLHQDGPRTAQLKAAGGTHINGWDSQYANFELGDSYYPALNSCFLQRVTGKFEGFSEELAVPFTGVWLSSYSNWWEFYLTSAQKAVGGTVQCVGR